MRRFDLDSTKSLIIGSDNNISLELANLICNPKRSNKLSFIKYCDQTVACDKFLIEGRSVQEYEKFRLLKCAAGDKWNEPKEIIFTPLLQISIGHFNRLIDLCMVMNQLEYFATSIKIIFIEGYLGSTLLRLMPSYFPRLKFELIEIKSIEYISTSTAAKLTNSNHYNDWIPLNLRKKIEMNIEGLTEVNKTQDLEYVLHIRTSAYKNDESSIDAVSRNSNPIKYNKLVEFLKTKKCFGTGISTDEGQYKDVKGVKTHVVKDQKTATEQQQLETINLIVGIIRISHLSGFSNGNVLLAILIALALHVTKITHC